MDAGRHMHTLGNKKTLFIMPLIVIASLVLVSPALANSAPYILLPTEEITIKVVKYPGDGCYYNIMLSDVPSGYHVSNGIYAGWCVDQDHYICQGVNYPARLYSSYDPENPYSSPQWDKINYILNHKKGTTADVQDAIWHFVNGKNDLTQAAQDMVNEANEHGEGFVPGPGQILAVVLYIDNNTQIPIIEVYVPIENVVPQYPLGPILGTTIFIAALCVYKYKRKN